MLMLQKLLMICLAGILASPLYAQNTSIETFLLEANSIDAKFDTLQNDFHVSRIDVTKASLIVDGKEMFIPASKEMELLIDSLLDFKHGELVKFNRHSSLEYFKVVKADSVLCMRFATIGITLNENLNIDSIYQHISSQLKKGVRWDELKHHPLHCYTDFPKTLKGQRGWEHSSQLLESFRQSVLSHETGEVF